MKYQLETNKKEKIQHEDYENMDCHRSQTKKSALTTRKNVKDAPADVDAKHGNWKTSL